MEGVGKWGTGKGAREGDLGEMREWELTTNGHEWTRMDTNGEGTVDKGRGENVTRLRW